MNEIRAFDDAEELNAAGTEYIAAVAAHAIAERGRFLLVMAGGNTPRGVYRRLASLSAGQIRWERVHVFWGDERCVTPDHPRSNFGMAVEELLRWVNVPTSNIHRIRGEEASGRAATLYDRELADFFGADAPDRLGPETAFDLVLLGVGDDGHTASLFPGSPALAATGWAASARAPESADTRDRVTLTLAAINASRECLFLVAGAAKREAIRQILRPPADPDTSDSVLPAARVRPRERSLWFLDAEAAGTRRT